MTTSTILYQQHDHVGVVQLNRPEKLNALSGEMVVALSEIFKEIEAETALRAVILTGTGAKAFCVGTDVSELATLDEVGAREAAERGRKLCNQIEACSVPVIAAINGLAVGGGCELALACHIRLASTTAAFGLPETKLGLIPGYGGTQRLAREIGRGRALEMMLTGRTVAAEEALRIGLVSSLAGSDDLRSKAEALAQEIAQLAPLAIRACIQAVTRGLELPLDQGLSLETELFTRLFVTKDMREGTLAFLEKRVPAFKGR